MFSVEKCNFFNFNIYTNTFLICSLTSENYDLVKYSLEKTPYLKFKTYNYIKSVIEYLKIKIADMKNNYYDYSKKYYIKKYGYKFKKSRIYKFKYK